MRIGHWDARFGISGDMALGSALAAGARMDAVQDALDRLGVPGLRVEAREVQRGAIACIKADVRWDRDGRDNVAASGLGSPREAAPEGDAHTHHAHDHAHAHHERDHAHEHEHLESPHDHPHDRPAHGRTHADIRGMLLAADLPGAVRSRALAVFAALAEAEGAVHGRPADAVHFHEVGGEDAIADVVGTCAALEDLGLGSLTCSALPAGGGTVTAAHGLLPVPAPAVALLLRGFDLEPGPVAGELVTPTGAALVAALCGPAPSWPAMRLLGVGWGAGTADFRGHPNACRLVWGEAPLAGLGGPRRQRLAEVETHIDDQSPEGVAYVSERLFALGALDVAVSPLLMKKQRPGVRIWALLPGALAEAAARCLFRESTALGVRVREVERWSLERDATPAATPWGDVSVKRGWLDGRIVNLAPEFEDCRRAAERHGVPLKVVYQAALAAATAAATAAAAAAADSAAAAADSAAAAADSAAAATDSAAAAAGAPVPAREP